MCTQLTPDALPKDAIFINVGRGDLVKSGELFPSS